MDGDDGFDDPIASALLGQSAYERVRVRRRSLFKQHLAYKLALQSAIFGALALVLPLAMTLPASTQRLFPGGEPLSSAPKILVLGAYAGAIEAVAALGLVYVGYQRVQRGDVMSEGEAAHLLNVEDAATMISLVTGAAAVVTLDGFFLLGHAGQELLAGYLAAGGGNPFAGTEIPVSVPAVAIPAAVLAVVLFVLSRYFRRELQA
ncbi:hypothetical protein C453_14326 [Haloferax elongans ATCC BAA-1513]|uniref:Uncharacterized protein n=1 Tax=Haloferax elongans ATCC BAA-1513 TaxID=1230453 RepID=M0HJC0_HALEO|nr:hypothetical protein [Haloferax elongans]ELZ83189.1 hypothetical protein C453_14326 [Haloferax elongans ATCC BAA-1513]